MTAADTASAPHLGTAAPTVASVIDLSRYRRVRRFFLGVLIHALWWDLLLNRPLLRRLRRDPMARWGAIARRFRGLALEMGGVLIKLGQFLSIRVDVLPPAVTRELAGLQDEVPPVPWEALAEALEAELGRPWREVFEHLEEQPVGAASLAQVHRARLVGGQPVVVKVLRPGIEVLVETDLKATEHALRWLKLSRMVRRRVDLDRLLAEFRRTTGRELDLELEGESARRFARMFAGDPAVRIPATFDAVATRRVLALEDVAFLKVTDRAALTAAGISLPAVARTLYDAYLRQIFVHHFIHSDPHPGNLFVEPLPTAQERAGGRRAFAPGEAPPAAAERPFRVVFIDFGMNATIPPHLRGALEELLIGLGTRDAPRVVRAYQQAGMLLPGADIKRLVEIHRDVFDRLWGLPLGKLHDVAMSQAPALLAEYRDLLFHLPFQMPVELLFASRAVGILSGLATSLDPDFDPWAQTIPFARRVAAGGTLGLLQRFTGGLRQLGRLVGLPLRFERLLTRTEGGELAVQSELAGQSREVLERLDRSGRRMTWVVAAAALLLAGALLLDRPGPLGEALLALAPPAFLWGLLRHR
jgi:predicted unusual protein kinase regulating ubiquinone biosynthesis (AarF/ABC1/UbiB family)